MLSQPSVIYDQCEVEKVVTEIHSLIKRNRYTISRRDKNIDFETDYQVKSKQKIVILNSLTVSNYSCSVKNRKPGYEHEVLHIFGVKINVYPIGEEACSEVEVYIKFNLIPNEDSKFCIVISFHEAEGPISYPYG